jgi:hypothetical protein
MKEEWYVINVLTVTIDLNYDIVPFTNSLVYLSALSCSEELSSNKAELSSVLRTMQHDIRTQRQLGEVKNLKARIHSCIT